jgi:hypothetical protein
MAKDKKEEAPEAKEAAEEVKAQEAEEAPKAPKAPKVSKAEKEAEAFTYGFNPGDMLIVYNSLVNARKLAQANSDISSLLRNKKPAYGGLITDLNKAIAKMEYMLKFKNIKFVK